VDKRRALFHSGLTGFYLGCREGEKKAIVSDDRRELYHLNTDPQERNDLSGDCKQHKDLHGAYRYLHSLFLHRRIAANPTCVLDFSHDDRLTDEKLIDILRRSPRPTSLVLTHCLKLSDKGFNAIPRYASELLILDLSGTMIQDRALKKICTRAKKLQQLRIEECLLLEDQDLIATNLKKRV
jgi:hypothetical protein